MLEQVPVGLGAHGIDRDVRSEIFGVLLELKHDVLVFGEVVGLGLGECARLVQPVFEMVDDDDAARAHEPRGFRGKEADRTGPEHDDRVALPDIAQLRAEIAGLARLREEDCVLVVHPVGDQCRPDVGEGDAHELALTAVVPAAGVGVAVDAADRRRIRIDVVAVGIQAARTEIARAATHVEGDHHPVALLQILDRGPTSSMTR